MKLFHECTEDTPTDYEKLRALNMNNIMFQRLGLNKLTSMMAPTSAKSKDDGPQESGSLYAGEDSEGTDQEEVSKVLMLLFVSSHYLAITLRLQ